MTANRYSLLVIVVQLLLALTAPVGAEDDIVIKAMSDEMARAKEQLFIPQAEKPYFIAFRTQDVSVTTIAASLGSLTATNSTKRRMLTVDLRVGDYSLDNSNFFSARRYSQETRRFSGIIPVPLDNDYLQLRRQLWLTTDAHYKRAIEDLSGKRAALQARKRTDNPKDFSRETPVQLREANTDVKFNIGELEQLARDLSLPFKQTAEITTSSVHIEAQNTYSRFLNSEGSLFTQSEPRVSLSISAEAQAADGLALHDSVKFFGRTVADLPPRKDLLAHVREMGSRLGKLRDAPYIERYNGPVMFENVAAAEIFAQAFAPGLVTSRMPVHEDAKFELFFSQMIASMGGGENFLEKIGGRVLPDFVNLVDDPRLTEYNGLKLAGSFKIDDDAVLSRRTVLVEKGILQTLLASRIPLKSIDHSTGSQRGFGPSPGNLILTADKTLTHEELKGELLRRVKLRNLDYGIIIKRVGGNGTNAFIRAAAMMAGAPQSGPSNVLLEVYKLFPDGREELAKGMELHGITAASFRDIVAVGNRPVIYNEQFLPKITSLLSMEMSGSSSVMPVVSYVIPSLLFEEITLTKAAGPFPNPPATISPLSKTSGGTQISPK